MSMGDVQIAQDFINTDAVQRYNMPLLEDSIDCLNDEGYATGQLNSNGPGLVGQSITDFDTSYAEYLSIVAETQRYK